MMKTSLNNRCRTTAAVTLLVETISEMLQLSRVNRARGSRDSTVSTTYLWSVPWMEYTFAPGRVHESRPLSALELEEASLPM